MLPAKLVVRDDLHISVELLNAELFQQIVKLLVAEQHHTLSQAPLQVGSFGALPGFLGNFSCVGRLKERMIFFFCFFFFLFLCVVTGL